MEIRTLKEWLIKSLSRFKPKNAYFYEAILFTAYVVLWNMLSSFSFSERLVIIGVATWVAIFIVFSFQALAQKTKSFSAWLDRWAPSRLEQRSIRRLNQENRALREEIKDLKKDVEGIYNLWMHSQTAPKSCEKKIKVKPKAKIKDSEILEFSKESIVHEVKQLAEQTEMQLENNVEQKSRVSLNT